MKKAAAKIKDAVTPGRRHHEGMDPTYATTGTGGAGGDVAYEQERVGGAGVGAGGYEPGGAGAMPMETGGVAGSGSGMATTAGATAPTAGMMEGEAGGGTMPGTAGGGSARETTATAGAAAMGREEEVCGRQVFTQVEDRPIVKERVERVVEHAPVEKTFVTETRFVGERPVATAAGETSLGVTERVVETAEPGPTCPAPGAPIVSRATGDTVGRVGEAALGEGAPRNL